MNLSLANAQKAMEKFKTYILKHKAGIGEVIKVGEATGAALLLNVAKGRLSKTGDGRLEVAGADVDLIAAGILTAAAASGYMPEYASHAGNMAAGLAGSWAGRLGTQLGLTMRAKAGLPVKVAAIDPARLPAINQALAASGKQLAAVGAQEQYAQVGSQEQYAQVGAAPQATYTAQQLESLLAQPGE